MVYNLYSLKDELVGFGFAQFIENDDVAIRSIRGALMDTPELRENAKDYSLYRLGSFDSATGHIVPLEIPYKVVDCLSLISKRGDEHEV